ncbi:MAG: YafY family transcriptional regulator [Actinobacteria bacterium]|nr:YafY family transcriptional regulator [Actinomycetota bacterium]MBO0834426.1 YafY family transcriptional regulator [Actinomycetota bacterium]
MVETSARLLRLLSLLQARPEWTGDDLAERLEVTPRTVRRDVAKLRSLGYPVHAAPGVAGGYRLGSGASLPPLLLDDDEAVAVAMSLRTSASHSVAGVGEASVRALTKLDQVLPGRLRDRAAAIGQATVPLIGPVTPLNPDALITIAQACRRCERLKFGYRDRDGVATERRVEPHRLVQAGYRWYLVARDLDRNDWRTFRADRIVAPKLTGVRFVPADPPDAAAFVARAVTTAPYRYQARILVHAPAEVVAQHVPPTVGMLETAAPGSSILTVGSDSLEALAFHTAMLDLDFIVLEPPELATRLAELASRLSTAARLSTARLSAAPAGQPSSHSS